MGLGNEGGGLECGCDSRIELNASVLVASELVISLLTSSLYPALEVRSYHRVDDIAHVGSGHLPGLSYNRKRINDISVAHPKVQDELHGEVVVLGDCDDLDVVVENGLKS